MMTLWFFVVWVLVGLLVVCVTTIYCCAKIVYENNWDVECLSYMTGFIGGFNKSYFEEYGYFAYLINLLILLIGWPFKVYWVKTTLIPMAVESYRNYLRSRIVKGEES